MKLLGKTLWRQDDRAEEAKFSLQRSGTGHDGCVGCDNMTCVTDVTGVESGDSRLSHSAVTVSADPGMPSTA